MLPCFPAVVVVVAFVVVLVAVVVFAVVVVAFVPVYVTSRRGKKRLSKRNCSPTILAFLCLFAFNMCVCVLALQPEHLRLEKYSSIK